jgi:hypothetical protein
MKGAAGTRTGASTLNTPLHEGAGISFSLGIALAWFLKKEMKVLVWCVCCRVCSYHSGKLLLDVPT